MGDAGNGAMSEFFGIPVVLMSYNSTVIPAIIAIWVYSFLYKFLDEHVPETLRLVVLPAVSLIIMVPATMLVIGPLGVYAGEGIASWSTGSSPAPTYLLASWWAAAGPCSSRWVFTGPSTLS